MMRIHGGVAVAWEMLAAGKDAVVLESGNDREAQRFNLQRIVAESPVPNDGILGIAVDVEDRGEVHIHSDRPKLFGRHFRKGIRQFHRSRAAERPLTREDGKSLGKARHAPAFLIDRDKERHRGRQFLKSVDQVRGLRRLLEVSAEENHAAGMIVLKESPKILRDFRSLEAKHEKLTDLLFQIHVVLLTLLSHPPTLGAPRRAFFPWPRAPFFTFAPCRCGELETRRRDLPFAAVSC